MRLLLRALGMLTLGQLRHYDVKNDQKITNKGLHGKKLQTIDFYQQPKQICPP